MKIHRNFRWAMAIAAVVFAASGFSGAQPTPSTGQSPSESACKTATPVSAVQLALRLVCQQEPLVRPQPSQAQTIVIGFVGGFANPRDEKHPEVLFAAYLREHYGAGFHAQVFSNHDEKGALRYVLQLLDSNHDGFLSAEEKRNARIMIYGHSWGASETAAFASELGRRAIPVLLTIQVDIIPKFRQKPFRIPANVESAINFYQSEGLLQGRPEISASDAARTSIIGNFRFTYSHRSVNCDNYPWMARTFNKPHHEIENDPDVWDWIASLINANISIEAYEVARIPADDGREGSSSQSENETGSEANARR